MIYLGKVMMSQKAHFPLISVRPGFYEKKNLSFPVPSQRNWHTKTLGNFEKLLNNKIDQNTNLPNCRVQNKKSCLIKIKILTQNVKIIKIQTLPKTCCAKARKLRYSINSAGGGKKTSKASARRFFPHPNNTLICTLNLVY